MKKLTKEQKNFLITYIVLHYFFLFIVMMVMGPSIRGVFSTILFAPMWLLTWLLVNKGFQLNPYFLGVFIFGELFFSGIVNGYIILYTYKFLRKK